MATYRVTYTRLDRNVPWFHEEIEEGIGIMEYLSTEYVPVQKYNLYDGYVLVHEWNFPTNEEMATFLSDLKVFRYAPQQTLYNQNNNITARRDVEWS